MEYSKRDLNALAATIYGEAANETPEGKAAVAHTVLNRVNADLWGDKKPDWWGEGVANVCFKDWQYSCWRDEPVGQGRRLRSFFLNGDLHNGVLNATALSNDKFAVCYDVAKDVLEAFILDPTHGATHYYADYITTPFWAKGKQPCKVIGVHRFFNDVEPGYEYADPEVSSSVGGALPPLTDSSAVVDGPEMLAAVDRMQAELDKMRAALDRLT